MSPVFVRSTDGEADRTGGSTFKGRRDVCSTLPLSVELEVRRDCGENVSLTVTGKTFREHIHDVLRAHFDRYNRQMGSETTLKCWRSLH